jgi:DNA-binding response OmpR family regulator
MTKQPARVTVLSVSPLEEDHVSLRGIFDHSTWKLFSADRVSTALALLRQYEISVVLCERDLMPGTWIDLLENVKFLSHPPVLIVTSRMADDLLWTESMNLGAWDVLPKPFDRTEIIRTIKSGWQHWYDQTRSSAKAAQVMTAAS